MESAANCALHTTHCPLHPRPPAPGTGWVSWGWPSTSEPAERGRWGRPTPRWPQRGWNRAPLCCGQICAHGGSELVAGAVCVSASSNSASLSFSQEKMWPNRTINKQMKVFVSAPTMPKQLNKDELGGLGKTQNPKTQQPAKHPRSGSAVLSKPAGRPPALPAQRPASHWEPACAGPAGITAVPCTAVSS